VTRFFLNFASKHISIIGEARHFKFCVPIDTDEFECMHVILPPKGMCSESRDLLKVWEMSDNISLTVQTLQCKTKKNRMWYIEWHHCQCP